VRRIPQNRVVHTTCTPSSRRCPTRALIPPARAPPSGPCTPRGPVSRRFHPRFGGQNRRGIGKNLSQNGPQQRWKRPAHPSGRRGGTSPVHAAAAGRDRSQRLPCASFHTQVPIGQTGNASAAAASADTRITRDGSWREILMQVPDFPGRWQHAVCMF
jgi:hypothetical protein